jgi:serine/threonine-protein kinase
MTTHLAGTCDWLIAEIGDSRLVEGPDLDPIVAAFRADQPYADAAALADHLVQLGLLTAYQATRLLEGEGRGLVLGPYVLADVIGTGSMGAVYRALGRADHKPYAVKVLPVRGPWNVRQARRKLQQFPQESHPAVVPWLDVGTSVGLHYLVWSFAEGETLATVIARDGSLTPPRAGLIGMQIAQALQWCERHRVWHGAIKPSNVMLGPDGQAQLLDFGIGVLLAGSEEESMVETLVESNALASLVDCTAPECVTDPAKRSVRGDQYSLGCVLYCALAGRYPFPDGTTTEKMLAHQREEPAPVTAWNPNVPTALAAVIDRLLQKSPEARYNHSDELIAALTPLARQSGIYTPPAIVSPFVKSRSSSQLLVPSSARLTTPPPSPTVTPLRINRPSFAIPPAASKPRPESGAAIPPTRPSSHARPVPDALPPTPSPRRTLSERLRRKLLFWRNWADPVACSLLAPVRLQPGETTTVQVVLHHRDRIDQAKSLPDWRGTQSVPDPLGLGDAIGLQLRLESVDVPRPLATIDWNGFSAAALFTVQLPREWPAGQPVQGTLTLGRHEQPVGRLEFAIPVATGRPTVY